MTVMLTNTDLVQRKNAALHHRQVNNMPQNIKWQTHKIYKHYIRRNPPNKIMAEITKIKLTVK